MASDPQSGERVSGVYASYGTNVSSLRHIRSEDLRAATMRNAGHRTLFRGFSTWLPIREASSTYPGYTRAKIGDTRTRIRDTRDTRIRDTRNDRVKIGIVKKKGEVGATSSLGKPTGTPRGPPN